MKPLVIFGTGEIAEVADFYFRETTERNVAAFTVDPAYVTEPTFLDRPVVPFDEVARRFPPASHDMFVALSYARMNRVREEKVAAAGAAGYALATYVSPRASVFTSRIGRNCFVLEGNTVQPFVTIGDNVTLWSGNHIGHHARIEDNVFISSHVVISGGVVVGRNSFLGVNATVADHVAVAPYTLLSAGALLMEDSAPEGVYVAPGKAELRKVKSTRLPKF